MNTATGPQGGNQGIKAQRRAEMPVRERTGRGWDEWFALLDAWGATTHRHGDIARWLTDEHHVDNWWAQAVAVAYEQERGMRAPGQQADGYFVISSSKTIAVPIGRLFHAFTDAELRERWLPGPMAIRTTIAPRSVRADWADGSTRIVVTLIAKDNQQPETRAPGTKAPGTKAPEKRTTVTVAHEKVSDADSAAQLKAFWRDRLAALKRLLEA